MKWNFTLSLFNPRTSFFKLRIVWLTFVIVLVTSGVIATIILINGSYELCGTSICFNNFVSYFKVPIAILAILIPVFAVYAAQHRSEISIEQIKQAESQNNFANFYKHQEVFKMYFDENQLNKLGDYRAIHILFFSNSRDGDVTFPKSSQFFLASTLTKIFLRLKDVEKISINDGNNTLLVQEHLLSTTKDIQKFAKHFKLPTERYPLIKNKDTNQIEINQYLQIIKIFITDVEVIVNFCPNYHPHLLLKNLRNIKIADNQTNRISLMHGAYKFNLDSVSEDGQSHVTVAEQITEVSLIDSPITQRNVIVAEQIEEG